METEIDVTLPRIPEFYHCKSIFVTGFSGFLGQALVEKILWSCPGVHRIYVLLRGKRNLTFQQRLDKIINSDVFSRVRERDGEEIKTRLIPVEGDTTLPELGISREIRTLIRGEVNMIFHFAASVRFDDPLITSVDINVKGTKSVVDLALEMSNLVVFVHISTAYSNCNRFEIEEKIYPPTAEWKETLKIRETIDERIFCTLSAKYSNHMPNTYVFAKALCEKLVYDHADRIPLVVVRPSIVIGAFKEPFIGWIANLNGPTGLLFAKCLGIVRASLADDNVMPDFIPPDIVIKCVLAAAHLKATIKDKEAHVYNCCTSERSISYSKLMELGKDIMANAPMKYMLWNPTTYCTPSYLLYYINFMLFQILPAFFIDIGLRTVGRKPMLWNLQRKIYIAMNAVSYFTLNYFHYHNTNGYKLLDCIPKEDKDEFYFNIPKEEFDPYTLLYHSTKHLQRKYLKMKPEDEPNARLLATVMYWLDMVVKTSFWLGVMYLVYKYQVLQNITNGTIEFLCNF